MQWDWMEFFKGEDIYKISKKKIQKLIKNIKNKKIQNFLIFSRLLPIKPSRTPSLQVYYLNKQKSYTMRLLTSLRR